MIPEEGFGTSGILLDAATLDPLRDALDAWSATAPTNAYGLLYNNVWREIAAFRALVERGDIAKIVCEVLAVPEVLLFQDNLVCKIPGNPTEIQWHQDYSYWPLDRAAGLTTWLALDDASSENGAMEYVIGSHRLGERAPADFVRGTGQPALPGLEPMNPDGRPTAFGTARAGELRFHHPLTWHRSGPNRTTGPRRAWTATWIVPEVRWQFAHAPHPYRWTLSPTDGEPVEGEYFPRFRAGDSR